MWLSWIAWNYVSRRSDWLTPNGCVYLVYCHSQRCESYRTQKNYRSVFLSKNNQKPTFISERWCKGAEQRISVGIWHRTWLQESATHCKQGPASHSRLSGGFRSSSQSPSCGQDTFLSCTPSPHVVEHWTMNKLAAAAVVKYTFVSQCARYSTNMSMGHRAVLGRQICGMGHNGPTVAMRGMHK